MPQMPITIAEINPISANVVKSEYFYHSKIVFYLLLLYFLLPIVEGPLRYFLWEQQIVWAIYLRDVFVVGIVLYFIINSLVFHRINKIVILLIVILGLHSVVGLFFLRNPLMVLFGWKVFLPVFLGVATYFVFVENLGQVKWFFLIFFLISVSGVVLNYFMEFPWEGLTYALDSFTIEGTRDWGIGYGIKRLAGFSRQSYAAATEILILGIFLVAHGRNLWVKAIVWLMAGLAIFITTSKSLFLAYFVITVLVVFRGTMPEFFKKARILQICLLLIVLTGLLLPILSYAHILEINFYSPNDIIDIVFASFGERLTEGWPEAIAMVRDNGSSLLGRGLGGIGVSQQFFESDLYYPADNVFVYYYGYFGVVGIFYLLYIFYKSLFLDSDKEFFLCLFFILFFQYGITQNGMEHAYFSLFLGFFLAYVSSPEIRMNYLLKNQRPPDSNFDVQNLARRTISGSTR